MSEKEGRPEPSWIQKRRHSQEHYRQREKDNRYIIAINSIADELKTTEQQEQAADKGKTRREQITIWLVVLTFAAAAIGDGIFWRTMQDAREADRPYLWLSYGDLGNISWMPDSKFPGLGHVAWAWRFTNYGRGMAVQMRQQDLLAVRWRLRKNGTFNGITPSVPVPPTMQMYSTAISAEVMTKATFDKLLQVNGGISMRVGIWYTDRFGNKYRTIICQYRQPNGAVGVCAGNEMQ